MNLLHRRPAPVPAGAAAATTVALDGRAVDTAEDTPAVTGRRSTRRSGRLSRIGGTLLTVVMALALIVFVAMTVLRISGGELLAIRTGSMTPMMKPGDLLISREVDARTIRRGDVITFRVPEADNTLVTHRVTKVDEKGNSFTTKGDANDTVDPFTTNAKDVLGIRWFSIPDVGRLMVFLSSGLGTALLIGIPAAIYFGQTLADRRALQRARSASAAPAPEEVAVTQPDATAAPDAAEGALHPAPDQSPDAPGPPPSAPSAAGSPPQWGAPPAWGAAPAWGSAQPWGTPGWGPQVHHVMPAAPPQVIVIQVPHQAPPSHQVPPPLLPTPPPYRTPPSHPTPPPFDAPTPSASGAVSDPTPIAVPAHELPPGLTRGLGAEWVLICPIEPSVAAHLRQQPHLHQQPHLRQQPRSD